MKILSVGIDNLNSLYGSHSIDFEKALGGASLFLIHGPTGSGKSTVMDAISLALFGQTPRLTAQRNMATYSPHLIMSRGTGQCSAEIVFSKIESGTRQVYRAKWTCRRARGRHDGVVQGTVRSLEHRDSDGKWVILVSSKKKKEYGPVFDKVLEGFGVDDFNRSMLLAQGQFDAFLGASAADRAEILERLTDTGVYQALGERAARMNRHHRRHIDALIRAVASGGGLGPEALAELEEQHAQSKVEREAQSKEVRVAESHAQWLKIDLGYQANRQALIDESVQLDVDVSAASERLERLKQHKRVARVHGFECDDRLQASRATLARLAEKVVALDALIPEQARDHDVHLKRAEALRLSVQGLTEGLDELRPLVQSLRDATRDQREVEEQQREAQRDATAVASKHQAAQKTLLGLRDELTQAGVERDLAKRALDDAHTDRLLSETWSGLREALERMIADHQRDERQTHELDERARSTSVEWAALEKKEGAFDRETAQLLEPLKDALAQTTEHFHSLFIGDDAEASQRLQDELETLGAAGVALQAALLPVSACADARRSLEVHASKRQVVSQQRSTSEDALKEASARVRVESTLHEQSALSLLRVERIAELVNYRSELVDAEPCLLCGSPTHPWCSDDVTSESDAEVKAQVAAQAEAHQRVKEALNTEQQREKRAEARCAELRSQEALLRSQEETHGFELEVLDQRARDALSRAMMDPTSSLDALDAALKEVGASRRATGERLAALDQARQSSLSSERALNDMGVRRREEESQLKRLRITLDERRKQQQLDLLSLAEAKRERAIERAHLGEQLRPFGLGTQDWEATYVEAKAGVARHEERLQRSLQCESAWIERELKLGGQQQLVEARRQRESECVQRVNDLLQLVANATKTVDLRHSELAQRWDALNGNEVFDGGLSEVLQVQQARFKKATAAFEQNARLLVERTRVLTTSRTKHASLIEQQRESQKAGEVLQVEWDSLMVALGWSDRQELVSRRLSESDYEAFTAKQRSLAQRQLQLITRTAERERALEAHRETRPKSLTGDESLPELEAALTAVKTLMEGRERQFQDLSSRLRDHERRMKEDAEARQTLDRAEKEGQVWQTLHHYIGLKDGEAFRQFAQALNLGQLLEKANCHLGRLSKRYRLVPRLDDGLPTLDFDLADAWQMDRRVSPPSLSGGERFLVSLALALGLSDFRSVKMPIETLLLDEGFGTLDSKTLGVALEALSQLQSDGRQVGIISHVAGLHERIEARIEVRPLGEEGRSAIYLSSD